MASPIDIFNLQPTVISKDLGGKYILIYGKPKCGKTSLSAQFPKNLLLAFEKGYNAIGGVKAVDITKWSDFKLTLRQLERPEARELYDTVTIDTTAIAWDLCEQYICAQNSVQKISDIAWGQGYSACKKEFESCMRKITQLGFGLVFIAHVDKRIETTSNGSEIEFLAPSIPKRCYDIVNQLVDIIGYIDVVVNPEDPSKSERWLYTRQTPTVMAGSRFKHLPPKIRFGYHELVEAIATAIENSEKLDGATVVDSLAVKQEEVLTYEEVRDRAKKLWEELVAIDPEENPKRIAKKVEMIFGRSLKLSEINEDQVDLYHLVVLEMEDMLRSA